MATPYYAHVKIFNPVSFKVVKTDEDGLNIGLTFSGESPEELLKWLVQLQHQIGCVIDDAETYDWDAR